MNKFLKHQEMPEDKRNLIGAHVEAVGEWEKKDENIDIEFLDMFLEYLMKELADYQARVEKN